jgi:hypothetical protein
VNELESHTVPLSTIAMGIDRGHLHGLLIIRHLHVARVALRRQPSLPRKVEGLVAKGALRPLLPRAPRVRAYETPPTRWAVSRPLLH